MTPKEPKISKWGAADTIRAITLIIPETIQIIRKPGSATNQIIIMAAYKIGLLTTYGIKKNRNRITCTNFSH
jgi:hypothetical protein